MFSKSYDPEGNKIVYESEASEEQSIDTADLEYEVLKNKPFEMPILKTKDQKDQLRQVLKSIVIFKYLFQEEIEEIINAMFIRPCQPNEVIIYEGQGGYYFYVIFSGVYDIYIGHDQSKSATDSYGVKYNEYVESGFFGELALLYDQVSHLRKYFEI